MAEFLASIISGLRKIGPVPLMALAAVTAILLFSPTSFLLRFGIDATVDQYRPWIGITGLVIWALLASHLFWWIRGLIAENINRNRTKNIRLQYLRELTPDEKSYLAPYVFEKVNTRLFSLYDGIAGGLVKKDILFRASSAAPVDEFPFNLHPWARRHLSNHTELLDGASVIEDDSGDRERW
jgi:hypothetical protein